jgi:NAD kinase
MKPALILLLIRYLPFLPGSGQETADFVFSIGGDGTMLETATMW